MKKVRKGGGGVVNIWSLKENISRMTFVNPNIPVLKYGRNMEIEAVNTFAKYITNYHQVCIISDVGWFSTKPCTLRQVEMVCSCCGKACIEIKCPCSANYTEANEYQNLDYLYKDG